MGYQRVRYIMINDDLKTSYNLETDPKNWDESEKSYKRSMKTFGVVTVLSKNLEFVKGGKDFLDFAYAFKGIEARVTLQEYKIHPNTEAEYLHSEGTFDFSGWENNKTITKIPFKTGGLNFIFTCLINCRILSELKISEGLGAINPEGIINRFS